jgi:hypothetical protein
MEVITLSDKPMFNALAEIRSSLAWGTVSSASPDHTDVPKTDRASDLGQNGCAFPAWRRYSLRSVGGPLSQRRQQKSGRYCDEAPRIRHSARLCGGTWNDGGPIVGTECT